MSSLKGRCMLYKLMVHAGFQGLPTLETYVCKSMKSKQEVYRHTFVRGIGATPLNVLHPNALALEKTPDLHSAAKERKNGDRQETDMTRKLQNYLK